jgi:hypothetical protein
MIRRVSCTFGCEGSVRITRIHMAQPCSLHGTSQNRSDRDEAVKGGVEEEGYSLR